VSDHPEFEDESPEIAEVRRVLADARHTEPMPDDVAGRMDRVIARLADEAPAAAPEPSVAGTVVPIAAHRRHRAAALLGAAAAIVVGGVVLGQVVHPSSTSSTASENAPAANQAQSLDNGKSTGGNGSNQNLSGDDTKSGGPGKTEIRHGRVVVRPKYFAYDALQGRRLLHVHTPVKADDRLTRLQGCGVLAKRAHAVPAEYQNAPAALLYRRPQGGSQIVNLVVCGSTRPIRSATLPAP
jgi:hypothetical protein